MEFLLLIFQFILSMILVICYYKFFELRKIKKYTKNNIPVDLKVFIEITKVDPKKIKYKKLMNIVMIINAFVVSFVFILTNVVRHVLLKFFMAIPIVILVLLLSYRFAGYILKKKGMTINES